MSGASWAAHYAAGAELGLDPRTIYETFDGGMVALRRASEERAEALRAAADELAAREESRREENS